MRVLALIAFLLSGCPEDEPTPDSGPGKDAGPDSGVIDTGPTDTGLSDTGVQNDAGTDAGPDAGNTATAVFTAEGSGIPGFGVIFHDSSGAVLEVGRTNAQGESTGPMTPGGMITLKIDIGGQILAQTIAGVSPGETVRFGTEADPVIMIAGDVDIRIIESVLGADHYEVDFGCGGSVFVPEPPVPTITTLTDDCLGSAGLASAIATARDIDGNILAFATVTDIMLGVTPTIVTIQRLEPDADTYTVNLTNAPPASESLETALALRRDGLDYESQQAFSLISAGTSSSVDFPEPPSFSDGVDIMSSLVYDATSPGSFSVVLHRIDSAGRTFDVDLGAELLPRVFSASVSVGAETNVSWSVAAAAPADAIVLQVLLAAADSAWTILIAPDATSPFTLPDLPQGFLPPASATEVPAIIYIELEPIADYDAFREVYGLRIFNGGPPAGSRVRFSAVNFR